MDNTAQYFKDARLLETKKVIIKNLKEKKEQ